MTDENGRIPSQRSPVAKSSSLDTTSGRPPLNSKTVAHLHPGRCVTVAGDVTSLRADSLEILETNPGQLTYRSTHGGVVSATDEVFLLLDTLLETYLPTALPSLGSHAAEPGHGAGKSPDGSGPYGWGVRALGSIGDRMFLNGFDIPVTDVASRWPLAHGQSVDSWNCGASNLTDDDAPHNREPWCEVFAHEPALQSWLMREMCWTSSDGDYSEYPATDEEHRRLFATEISRMHLTDHLLSAFPPDAGSRYFVGAHAGWDPWWENLTTRDQVVGFASDTEVAILWMSLHRHYG